MMTTPNHSLPTIPLTLCFTSDWGVGTGTGVAGTVHAQIEKDAYGFPVVRGSVLTGVIREQAFRAASALDNDEAAPANGGNASKAGDAATDTAQIRGRWLDLAKGLFGSDPNSVDDGDSRARLIVISDATFIHPGDKAPVPQGLTHEVVSLSIDPDTGTAKNDHLRVFERARPMLLRGEITLLTSDRQGRSIEWSDQQLKATTALLQLAGLLVPAIGSNRSDGDGQCTILIGSDVELGDSSTYVETEKLGEAKKWLSAACAAALEEVDQGRLCTPTVDTESWEAPQLGLGSHIEVDRNDGDDDHSGTDAIEHRICLSNTPGITASVSTSEYMEATVDIALDTPVVSYEVPMSNEVRSLDFLRGTVLLPWVHHRLRHASKGTCLEAAFRDAVVKGDLFVSNAVAVVDGKVALPVPMVLSTPKDPAPDTGVGQRGTANSDAVEVESDGNTVHTERPDTDSTDTSGTAYASLMNESSRQRMSICNRLKAGDPDTIHKPLREGYIFVSSEDQTPVPAVSTTPDTVRGYYGSPPLIGRQSTAHNAETGAARTGSLFLVRALPAGLHLRATITISKTLFDKATSAHDDAQSLITRAFPPGEPLPARLGSRRLSGTFGKATCEVSLFAPARRAEVNPDNGTTTLWFTSDVIARSKSLGPGGSIDDLLRAFKRHGIDLERVESLSPDGDDSKTFTAAVRHRRVDSWSAAEHEPRATRMAISAGSVVRVKPTEEANAHEVVQQLVDLSVIGVGELTAQGYGRFVVGHRLLDDETFELEALRHSDFVPLTSKATLQSSSAGSESAEEQRR